MRQNIKIMNEEIFKLRIKDILQEKGMTQKELATLMGKSPQYIANILNAKQGVSTNVLIEIAKHLDVEFRDMFAVTKTDLLNEFRCPYCGNFISVVKKE